MNNWIPLLWLGCGVIGALIGTSKNRKASGLFLGLILGPLGWLITMFSSRREEDPAGVGTMFCALGLAVLIIVGVARWQNSMQMQSDKEWREIDATRAQTEELRSRQAAQSLPEPAVATPAPAKPGDWMWQSRSSLNR